MEKQRLYLSLVWEIACIASSALTYAAPNLSQSTISPSCAHIAAGDQLSAPEQINDRLFNDLVLKYQNSKTPRETLRAQTLLEIRSRQLGWQFDSYHKEFKIAEPSKVIPADVPLNELASVYKKVSEAGYTATPASVRERIWREIAAWERRYGVWVDRESKWYGFKVTKFSKTVYPLAAENRDLADLTPESRQLIPENSETIVVPIQIGAGSGSAALPVTDDVSKSREKLGLAVAQFEESSHVEATLYLLCGSDAVLGTQLFPHSQTTIGVDAQPFVPWKMVGQPMSYQMSSLSSYDTIREVEDDSRTALVKAILGRMSAGNPQMRIRKAVLFSTPGRHMVENPNDAEIHGLIEYDSGPGTPVKRLLHIQSKIDGAADPGLYWWYRHLTNNVKPTWSALISKASMNIYNVPNGLLRARIVEHLRAKRGMLVEDRGLVGDNLFSFSNGEVLSSRRLVIEKIPFGYPDPGPSFGMGRAQITAFP